MGDFEKSPFRVCMYAEAMCSIQLMLESHWLRQYDSLLVKHDDKKAL